MARSPEQTVFDSEEHVVQIERLRAMANDALAEYEWSLKTGGEASFPQWAQDILAVCDRADASLHADRAPAVELPIGNPPSRAAQALRLND